jgi:hypothetical protein
MRTTARALLGIALIGVGAHSIAQARAHWAGPTAGWQTFAVPDFGTTVEYPAGIFSVTDGKADKGIGQKFSSADGSALLTVYSSANDSGETPMSYLRNNLRLPRAALDYERVTPAFFAISSTRQGLIFYSRCNFSAVAGGAIHCFDLVYPSRYKRAWDLIVTRISRSLRPLEG